MQPSLFPQPKTRWSVDQGANLLEKFTKGDRRFDAVLDQFRANIYHLAGLSGISRPRILCRANALPRSMDIVFEFYPNSAPDAAEKLQAGLNAIKDGIRRFDPFEAHTQRLAREGKGAIAPLSDKGRSDLCALLSRPAEEERKIHKNAARVRIDEATMRRIVGAYEQMPRATLHLFERGVQQFEQQSGKVRG